MKKWNLAAMASHTMALLDVDPQILLFLIFAQVSSDKNIKISAPPHNSFIEQNQISHENLNTLISSLRGCSTPAGNSTPKTSNQKKSRVSN